MRRACGQDPCFFEYPRDDTVISRLREIDEGNGGSKSNRIEANVVRSRWIEITEDL
jgi:hypothetical protein